MYVDGDCLSSLHSTKLACDAMVECMGFLRDTDGRGLHSLQFPLNLSLLCPFPLHISSLCPPLDPNLPANVSRDAQVELT